MPLLALILAAVPSAGVLAILYWLDRYQREPAQVIFRAFLLGATALPMVFFINAVLPGIPTTSGVTNSIVVAPFTEELYKFAAFMLAVYWSREHDEPVDAIIYYVAVGVGFAVAENFTFIAAGLMSRPAMLQESVDSWLLIAAIRSFPGHALFGALGGYFAGISRLNWGRTRVLWLLLALVVSIVTHALFNLLASVGIISLMILFIVGLSVFALILANDAVRRSPRHPESDVPKLDERFEIWKAEGYREAGPLVFTAFFVVSIVLIFGLAYGTIWLLTWAA